MIHERPGVWSAFGAQGTTELTDRRLAAVIAPADAAEGVQLVHSAAEAVSLYGGNALLTRMLKLCLANCGDPVYAVAVDEDTKVAYETALTALFTAAKPGILIVGSAREDVQLLLRETAEANECLGVAGMKGASADALVARAKALCCARIVLTGPDVLAQDEAVADGFCAAAAVGGAIASLSTPVVPLHDVALFGLQSLSALYTDDELDKLLQAGVTPVQLSGGRMCALRILTTRATAEGPEGESFRSLNATLVTDELLRDLRAALAARFRAAQNSTLTRTAIRSAVLLVLQDYRARGWLSAFGNLRVYADAGDASLCRVEFTYSIPAGLHRIALSAQMSRLRRGSMTGICIPTSADIRIEVAGRRVAVVQSYRVEEEASCEVVGAIGSNEPVGVVRGPARYHITLQRVYATDEAISDGLRFHELRQFSLVIAKPDTMVVFSGCEWERLTERAEVGSSVLEEAVVLAAVRGEYEQQEG